MPVYHCYYVPSDGIHFRDVEAATAAEAVRLAATDRQIQGKWRATVGPVAEFDVREHRSYIAEEIIPGEPPF